MLVAAFPESMSLDKLVMLDHILVHTGDFGGPQSVHPPSPLRLAEPYVRRDLVRRGLTLFKSRNLTLEIPSEGGFAWRAADRAGPFVEYLSAPYHRRLKEAAAWTWEKFGDRSERALTTMLGDRVISAIGVETLG